MNKDQLVILFFILILSFSILVHAQKGNQVQPRITFVELGSVNCIPCKKMQPIMKSIEEKYSGQVKVVFHDVWKEDQKQYATKYGIKLIPTQVFLDSTGKEFSRHEGFYPEAEIDKLLQKKGLTPKAKKN
jgi:thioredoxin 1